MGRLNEKCVASAPGRLDFLGGVADYSGSLVLETPIRAKTRAEIKPLPGRTVRVGSTWYGHWEIAVEDLLRLRLRDAPTWTRYVLGCLWVLSQEKGWAPKAGLDVRIQSSVPSGAGVASSAALEVAVLRALGQHARIRWKGTELARLAQRAENDIVGAPCGLMDQLTSHHGAHGELLPILCRPDQLLDPIAIPRGLRIVGWHSGVQHSVSADPYMVARTATFMGRRIFEEKTRMSWDHAAEIPPSAFDRLGRTLLPESIRGDSFLKRYGRTSDSLSIVERARSYRVRDALEFPVRESFRAELATSLLRDTGKGRAERFDQVGELMLQSHAGYSALGLGSYETDQMVDAAMAVPGVYGARASGGGSGGTVVLLLESGSVKSVRDLAQQTSFSGVRTSLIQ